jgi:predicted GNAT superfamily acetyltransferase
VKQVDITELSTPEDLSELEALFGAVWGRPGEPPISSDTLRALVHSGNYAAGAFVAGRLAGGLVGWLGRGAPPEPLHLHSHILGVVAGSEARGLGFQLKQHQRRWCLERGITTIEWTTDPLVRRNAYFNLTKLGAQADRYLVNFYGAMTDGINSGEESDRLLITWRLDSARALAAAEGRPAEADVGQLLHEGAAAVLSVGSDGEPVEKPADARILLCEVPDDIVALRRADPALARTWRLALRTVLAGAFAAGYAITGATRSGWYVLQR